LPFVPTSNSFILNSRYPRSIDDASLRRSRIAFRPSGVQGNAPAGSILRRTADAAHKSLTDFILDSACHVAEQTLLDQRLFMVYGSQYGALIDMLDQPPKDNADLRDLFAHKAPSLGASEPAAGPAHSPDGRRGRAFLQPLCFAPSPLRDDQLRLLLKDARRLMAG
jgi:uncharacterized protein (DUF1778 family)